MVPIKFDQFRQLTEAYNVIPVCREIVADFDTPISLAAKLESGEKYFLLESVEGGENWGRFSILGFDIHREFVIKDGAAHLIEHDVDVEMPGNPIDQLQNYLKQFRMPAVNDLPRFCGGVVGYLSFEAVRFFERCGKVHPNNERFPDAHFLVADHLAVFDNVSHTLTVICCVHVDDHADTATAYQHGLETLDRLEHLLMADRPADIERHAPADIAMAANMTQSEYEAIVRQAKAYISDGDIIQVVLAQHFTSQINSKHLDVYRALRHINPSPYLYLLKLDERRTIAGSSPEVMLRVTDRKAELRPIAGTRPRGATLEHDQALAAELLADPKEIAEHVMLVDLARNDLGRIASIGSVTVADYMFIERYSHVMHLVSQVEGMIRPEFDAIDVLKASFPAGTLSGAPKVRAMEIINELETESRGPYGGALGYIGYGGAIMDMAITIRTVVMDGDQATVTAGAGIVHDSVPTLEYEETLHKSRGMKRALELAEHGLDLAAMADLSHK